MKNFNSRITTNVLAAALLLPGCATSGVQNRINEKLAREPEVTQPVVGADTAKVILAEAGLSQDQRARLLALRDSTRKDLAPFRAEAAKLHSLLIREVITSDYDPIEVQAVKNRLRDLEVRRLNLMFNAIDRANEILGRQAAQHSRLIEEYLDRGNHFE